MILDQEKTMKAILAINPEAEVSWFGDDTANIVWGDTAKISDSDLQAKITEMDAEYDAQDYARKRKAEYDRLNQFELISNDAIVGNGTSHRDAILAIKAKYPKP